MSNNNADDERLEIAMSVVARCRIEGELAAHEKGGLAKCPYHVTRDPLEHAGWSDGWTKELHRKAEEARKR